MSIAINLLSKYIRHRQKAIKKLEKEKQEPELNADLVWADEKIKLF